MTLREAKKIVNSPEFGIDAFSGSFEDWENAHVILIQSGELFLNGKFLVNKQGIFAGLSWSSLRAKVNTI